MHNARMVAVSDLLHLQRVHSAVPGADTVASDAWTGVGLTGTGLYGWIKKISSMIHGN